MTELVRATTPDGFTLDGCFCSAPQASFPIDTVLLVHGTGSHFYAGGVLQTFAQQAAAAGLSVLRVNTRGHDGLTWIHGPGGSQPAGAAYEQVSDCRHDLAAWLSWLESRGSRRVALVGHSMGAVKSIYTCAHDAPANVQAIVAISPPRFCHQELSADPAGAAFRNEFSHAQQLVQAGQGETLLWVTQPLSLLLTAGGFVDKYGPADTYDFVGLLERVHCPTLVLLGERAVQQSAAFRSSPAAISEVAARAAGVQLQVIPGAAVPFQGCLEVPFERASAWWNGLS